ncbi:MAG: hypothetical protein SNJ71_00290 [Bacteroidales bacterium]
MKNLRFQAYETNVTAANNRTSISFSVNQDYEKVIGIFAVVNDKEQMANMELQLKHQSVEILPEKFDLCLINEKDNIAMNDYMYHCDLTGKNSKITGNIIMGNDVNGKFPVRVKLYLVCSDANTKE